MVNLKSLLLFFFFNDTATTEIYTLSLHDALPIRQAQSPPMMANGRINFEIELQPGRSEEHTSELLSPCNLVCRLLLEKKKKKKNNLRFKKKKKKKNKKKNTKENN